MFDNEIDWVTHLKNPLVRREAREGVQVFKGVYIQGRAQAEASASCLQRQVFNYEECL
jgi:ribosomal protein L19